MEAKQVPKPGYLVPRSLSSVQSKLQLSLILQRDNDEIVVVAMTASQISAFTFSAQQDTLPLPMHLTYADADEREIRPLSAAEQ